MIGKAIAFYLEKNGITINSLAEKTGLPHQYMEDALQGKYKFSVEEYYKICTVLGLPLDYFFMLAKEEYIT